MLLPSQATKIILVGIARSGEVPYRFGSLHLTKGSIFQACDNIWLLALSWGWGIHRVSPSAPMSVFCVREPDSVTMFWSNHIPDRKQMIGSILVHTVLGLPWWHSGKESPCQCWRHRVWFLGQEDPPEEEMATHSSTLAWEIPWTEKPGGLQSMGSRRQMTEHASKCSVYFGLTPGQDHRWILRGWLKCMSRVCALESVWLWFCYCGPPWVLVSGADSRGSVKRESSWPVCCRCSVGRSWLRYWCYPWTFSLTCELIGGECAWFHSWVTTLHCPEPYI